MSVLLQTVAVYIGLGHNDAEIAEILQEEIRVDMEDMVGIVRKLMEGKSDKKLAFFMCERGNVLLADNDGNMISWMELDDRRLQVSWNPGNYPSLIVNTIEISDDALAKHINAIYQGWSVRKCNVEGVNIVEGVITEGD